MEISDAAIEQAEQRMRARLASTPRAVAARFDRRVSNYSYRKCWRERYCGTFSKIRTSISILVTI